MPQPDTLALVDFAQSAPFRRSRRDFLTGTAGRRSVGEDYWVRVHRRAMACRFEVTLASRDAADVPAARVALNEIDRLEDQLSVFREESATSYVNRRAASEPVAIDETMVGLLAQCDQVHRDTAGAFDITSTPLSRCWGFLQREGRLPSREAIDAARALVGFDAVDLDRGQRTVRFRRPGMELNFGAIGKGYALDRVAINLRASGGGHALLSAGRSSLLAIGGRDAGWYVEIVAARADDAGGDRPLADVWLRDAAIGTSGAGEQFVIADGTRYGHVIDPRTGWPAAGVLSASVIAPSAALADALSTAFLIGGVALAERYCAAHPNVMALVTPDDGSNVPRVFGNVARVIVQTASACGPSASGGGAPRALSNADRA